MQLTNLATGEDLTLPNDLIWSDEHSWTPTISSHSYLITGALLIQSATKQTGREITLIGPVDMGWVTRATLETLRTWAAQTLTDTTGRFQLTLEDGRNYTVAFRHNEVPIESEPVLGFAAQRDEDLYRMTLRFMEI